MDFNSLFAQFAPQLTGAADASPMAGAAPSLLGSTRPTTAPPMPMRAPFTAPPPQSRGGGAMDMIAEIAPLILSAFTAMKGDPGAAGALMQGVARGRQLAMDRQLKTEEREKDRKQIAARFLQQVATDAQQYGTLQEHQQYLDYTSRIAPEFDVDPAAVMAIPFSKTKEASQKRTEAQKRLQALESSANYKDIIGTPQESGLSVTMEDGERLTVAQLRERAGMALYDTKGTQVVPTPAAKPEPKDTRTELEQHTDDLLQIWQEKNPGQAVTATVRVQAREQAKKGLGQADDRPVDNALRDLQRQGVELSNELKRSQIANKSTAGLPAASQRRVDTLARGFDQQAAVKRAGTMAEAVSFANGMDPNTKNPADDQALIYAFAKAMDPDSVVREGEYATVQKYAQSWAEKFGFDVKRVFSNTTFLTPQARANMKATVQQKFAATKGQYDNLRRSYGERINRITGQPDGDEYLTDYAGGFPGESERRATAAAPAAPAGAVPTMRWNPATGRAEPIKR